MEQNSPGAGFSDEKPAGSELEEHSIRFRGPGVELKFDAKTASDSPKSVAVCLLFAVAAILALTGGLGGLCHWLACPSWLCLTTAGIGLVISASLTVAFAAHVKRRNEESDAFHVLQEIHRAQPARDRIIIIPAPCVTMPNADRRNLPEALGASAEMRPLQHDISALDALVSGLPPMIRQLLEQCPPSAVPPVSGEESPA